jgi:hypothetical protein
MTPPEVLYLCITPDNTPVVVLDEGPALYMTGRGQVYEAHLLVDGSNGVDLRTAPAMRIASLEAEVARLRAEVEAMRFLGELWYFVSDEAPLDFESIVTGCHPSLWIEEARKLRERRAGGAR